MNSLKEWIDLLRAQWNAIDVIQALTLVLGVAEVLLARANHVWLYPTGIAATALGTWSLWHAQLYAEGLLNLYYLVMSFYGWWYWIYRREQYPLPVTFATRNEWIITSCIVALGWVLLYTLLIRFTPSQVPAWDAWVSATGWAGMWLLARRKVENWLLLNISNAWAIPLLIQKQLPLLALLTLFLFIVACRGYVDWMRLARKHARYKMEGAKL